MNRQKEPEVMWLCRVILLEQGAEEAIAFECWAADYAHAIEQTENAYPGCTILTIEQTDEQFRDGG